MTQKKAAERTYSTGELARRTDEPIYFVEAAIAGGYLHPSICVARGPGTRRRFAERDVVLLRALRTLRNAGVVGRRLRAVMEDLYHAEDLRGVRLRVDGGEARPVRDGGPCDVDLNELAQDTRVRPARRMS
jgi:hypothetical protein